MRLDDLCSNHGFYCFLSVVVSVRAKEEGGLTSIELLTRGLLIDLEHSLNLLTLHSPLSLTMALPNIRLSSAKNRWEIVGPLTETATPLRVMFWTALCNNADSPSAQMRKR